MLSKHSRFVGAIVSFLSLFVFAGGCTVENEPPEDADFPANELPEDAELREIVTKYIGENKEWQVGEYVVKRSHQEGTTVIFSVIHNDDAEVLVPGGGKSVEVHVDLRTMTVTRELAFQ